MEPIRIEGGALCVSSGVARDGGIARGGGLPRLRAARKWVLAPRPAVGSVSSSEPHAPAGTGAVGLGSSVPVREYRGVPRTVVPSVGACPLCRCQWLWCFWVSLCYCEALVKIRASFTPCHMPFCEKLL